MKQFQLQQLKVTGLSQSGNQVPDAIWHRGQKVNIEIKPRDDLPSTDARYGKKLVFVEGGEMGVVSNRDAELPAGTSFQAVIQADKIATANLHLPGVSTPIKFGKVNHFDYAGHHFRGEKVQVTIEEYQPAPVPVFKLNNQIVGELDADSIQLLKAQQKLTKNNQFQVTLNSYGKLDNLSLHTLATWETNEEQKKEGEVNSDLPSPAETVSLKLNRQALNHFKNYRFNQERATAKLDFQAATPGLAVKINGKIAGMFTTNQRASQNALIKAFGQTHPRQLHGLNFESKITSNLTTASIKIMPETLALGEIKSEPQLSSPSPQPPETTTNFLLKKMKQLPSLAFKYEREGETKFGLSVDYQVANQTSAWLSSQGVTYQQLSYQDPLIEAETQRGYAVFSLAEKDISPAVETAIKHICGGWLDGNVKLSSFP